MSLDSILFLLLYTLSYINASDVRKEVCSNAKFQVKNRIIDKDLKVDSMISDKPMTVYSGSLCGGMEGTCCHFQAEKLLMAQTQLEFHNKLQEYLTNRLAICTGFGRKLGGALFNNMKESKTILEEEISGLLKADISALRLFDNMFTYLYQFVYKRDFCQLRNIIEGQVRILVHYILEKESLSPNCESQLEDNYIDIWTDSSMQQLVEILNKVKLLSETSDLIKSVINQSQQHKFHNSCRKAIFTLGDCARCIGYSYVRPCDGNCLNVFKGCMSELADISLYLENLLLKYRSIFIIINDQLEPVKFVRNGLITFIQLVRHLKQHNHTQLVESGCLIRNKSSIMPGQDNALQFYKSQQKFGRHILDAMEYDERCFTSMISTFKESAEGICDIEPSHLNYIRNYQCWNGTAVDAEYNEDLAGPFSEDQITNPAYHSNPIPLKNQYQLIITQINSMIQDMNYAVNYVNCLNSDDEDCSTEFVLKCEPSIPDYSGSGSGASGSGSGEFYDIAQNGLISIVVGPPQRFNDGYENDRDIITEKTINSAPTTGVQDEYTSVSTSTSITKSTRLIDQASIMPHTGTTKTLEATNYPDSHAVPGSGYSIHSFCIFMLLLSLVVTYFHV